MATNHGKNLVYKYFKKKTKVHLDTAEIEAMVEVSLQKQTQT